MATINRICNTLDSVSIEMPQAALWFLGLADIPILTEDTAQIAMAEEGGAGTLSAHQGVFLAEMGSEAGDHRP